MPRVSLTRQPNASPAPPPPLRIRSTSAPKWSVCWPRATSFRSMPGCFRRRTKCKKSCSTFWPNLGLTLDSSATPPVTSPPTWAADQRPSALQQTAPSEEDGEKFVITHPFHPLTGEQFEALGQNSRWGDCRVWFRDAAGDVRTIPLSFTSLAPLVSAIGSPRTTLFRARDLLELAEL